MYRIVSEQGIGAGTKIIDLETDKEIKAYGVAIPPFGSGDVVNAQITLGLVQLDIRGMPTWHVLDPRDGLHKEVKQILFADGSVWPEPEREAELEENVLRTLDGRVLPIRKGA